MRSFRSNYLSSLSLPLSTVWLLTDIAEAKGRQDLISQRPPEAPWLNYFLTVLKRAYRDLERALE